MFILLINCPFDDVISESQRKGTAILGGGQIFRGLLSGVVVTPSGICDKVEEKQQNRVAKAGCGAKKKRALRLAFLCVRVCVCGLFHHDACSGSYVVWIGLVLTGIFDGVCTQFNNVIF